MEIETDLALRMKQMRDKQAGSSKLNPLEKLKLDPASKAKAIKAMCFQCMGGVGADPGWRGLIRDCTAKGCALYQVRPYQAR